MDTMKAGGFNGPTNGAEPIIHTDGNRMVDQIIAERNAGHQAQAHAQRVAAAQAQARAASASESEPDAAAESSINSDA
ncbi:hypothetical protein [Paraburkholderia strydomiana]|uniref:hypothetical protein n=1 Tax=Paraburkholderia strydomiana TaxID=1245417 RepID=UPI0038BAD9C8